MSHLVDFEGMPWMEPGKHVRSKTIIRGNQQIRLVEFTHGFVETDWCLKGHATYVLEGEFASDYSGSIERYKAGDVIFVPKGEKDKHKAIIEEGKRVLLLLFEILDD